MRDEQVSHSSRGYLVAISPTCQPENKKETEKRRRIYVDHEIKSSHGWASRNSNVQNITISPVSPQMDYDFNP